MPVRVRPTAPPFLSAVTYPASRNPLSTFPRHFLQRRFPMRRRSLATGLAVALLLCSASARAFYSPATTGGWFITAGRVQGQFESLFRTDVWLFNPDTAASVTVTLTLLPAVGDGASPAAPISS